MRFYIVIVIVIVICNYLLSFILHCLYSFSWFFSFISSVSMYCTVHHCTYVNLCKFCVLFLPLQYIL
jgi:hypothetical protein